MKKIKNSYLKKHMKSAITQLLPHNAEQIWEQPAKKASGDEWYLDGVKKPKNNTRKFVGIFASVAACFAICFLSLYMVGSHTDATIYLDVNPSIELQINRSEKIVRAKASNQDAEIILEDMHLEKTDLNVAINAILGSMVKHGYLTEAKNMILLSVNCNNQKKADELRTRLSDEMNSCLDSLIGSSLIFTQNVHTDDEIESLAATYGITPGKAVLLQKLVAANPTLNFAELAGLSMNDLTHSLKQTGIDLKNFTEYTGTTIFNKPNSEDKDNDDSDWDETHSDTDHESDFGHTDLEDETNDDDTEYSDAQQDNQDESEDIDLDHSNDNEKNENLEDDQESQENDS